MKQLLRSAFDLEEYEEAIREGIYSQDTRSDMLENDEISGWEAAFMDGWDKSTA